MSMYAVYGEILNGIAHAIQSKTGSDEPMTVASMASAIEGISGGIDAIEVIPLEFQPGYISSTGIIATQSPTHLEVTSQRIKITGSKVLLLRYSTQTVSNNRWFACGMWYNGVWQERTDMALAYLRCTPTEDVALLLYDRYNSGIQRDEIVVSFRTYGDFNAQLLMIDLAKILKLEG